MVLLLPPPDCDVNFVATAKTAVLSAATPEVAASSPAQPQAPAPAPAPALSVRRTAPVVVPVALVERPIEAGIVEYVVLGAGCAGLSLCLALLAEGITASILIIDQRTEFADDRTWCWWDVEPTPFTGRTFARWVTGDIRSAGVRSSATSTRYPYVCLSAADFYEDALAQLALHPNVTLRLGTQVDHFSEGANESFVVTAHETFRAKFVIDGRGLATDSATVAEIRRTSTWVAQQFVGQRIRSDREIFTVDRCTLMDFAVSQKRGLRFMYVLPFSATEALVENVYLSNVEVSPAEHRAELDAYIERHFGLKRHEYVIDAEEAGYIPMTDHAFATHSGERTYAIGMRGGSTRSSTGYTFLGIQREVKQLASTLASAAAFREEAPTRPGSKRLAILDAVFLRFLANHPAECPAVFTRMFRTDAESLIRFLSESSTVRDELRLIMSLPKRRFLGVAVATAALRVRKRLAHKLSARKRR